MSNVVVFNFEKVSTFLNSHLREQPKRGWGLARRWAEALNISPTLMSQVLKDHKDLTLEQAYQLAALLSFTPVETRYFLALVQRQRAGNKKLQNYFTNEIRELKEAQLRLTSHVKSDKELSEKDKAIYYSSWLYSAIRNFCSIGEGQTVSSVSEAFGLSKDICAKSLEFLLSTGLCMQTPENKIIRGPAIMTLGRDSVHLRKHHTHWRLKALARLDDLNEEEMMITTPMAISRNDFNKIREQLMEIFKKTLSRVQEGTPEEVACLHLDLFWVSNRKS